MNEPMHRFKYTKLTKEQVDRKLAATAAGPKCASGLSDALAGQVAQNRNRQRPRSELLIQRARMG